MTAPTVLRHSTLPSPDYERVQERNTPAYILNPIRRFYGGKIDRDPCSNPTSLVRARWVRMRPEAPADEKVAPDTFFIWRGRVFLNPPFNDLGPWVERAASSPGEVVALLPVRTHRSYWRHVWGKATAICWLGPVSFEGVEWSAPWPCCLVYWGPRPADFLRELACLGVCMNLLTAEISGATVPHMPKPSVQEKAIATIHEDARRRAVAVACDELIAAMRETSSLADVVQTFDNETDRGYALEAILAKEISQLGLAPLPNGKAQTKPAWDVTYPAPKKKAKAKKKAPPKVTAKAKAPAKKTPTVIDAQTVEKAAAPKAPRRSEDDVDTAVRNALLTHVEPLSKKEIEAAAEISTNVSYRALQRLLARPAKKGIVAVGEGRNTRYRPG